MKTDSPSPVRTALITGGSRGIGAAIAARLSNRGCQVLAPLRSQLDLSISESVEAYLQANRSLDVDILINNAGINILRPLCEVDSGVWQSMLQTNLSSALRLIQAFAPGMQERGWGRILNVSSILSIVSKDLRSTYSVTKAALNALTRSAAVEFGPAGVLVNSLAPGYVDTELTRQNNSSNAMLAIAANIPLRRLAKAEELAKYADFIVSEENTYLTGQTIVVDGGFICQ